MFNRKNSASTNFMLNASVWLVLGVLMGLTLAIQFVFPDFFRGVPWFVFGRLRQGHTNTVMFAFLQVSFDIKPEQMNELEIGSSLKRTLGYLKTLLPRAPGFIAARGMYSLDIEGITHLIFETVWDTWENLSGHQKSSLAEDKVLREFQPHVGLQHLSVHK